MVNQAPVPEESGAETRAWVGYTPAGQRLVVKREADVWLVTCDERETVRHRLLDVALIEAIRSDVNAHWHAVDYGEWTRLIADNISRTWPSATSPQHDRNEHQHGGDD